MSRMLLALAFLAFAIGLLFSLDTIIPNRQNLLSTRNRQLPPFPVSFGWIATQERDRYVEHALRLYIATVATKVGVVTAVIAILAEVISVGS
jgi:hypothetical protein